jgi:indolepyruvate ferredoxin oxidoreductase alpha subunit
MLLLGNEAIARGAFEAGVAVASTYPGTPSSEISNNFFEMAKESDLYFEFSTNEKVAMEVAASAANTGVRSMCIMKHVGLNVAADVLMTLAYVGVNGGMVIVSADDPFMFSSQNEQDNRLFARFAGIPMVEPSCVEEAARMIGYAFELSESLKEPVLFRTTTRINHSSEIVTLGPITEPNTSGTFHRDPFRYVPVPAVARKLHGLMLENQAKAEKMAETSPYNFVEGEGSWGVICNGVSHNYVSDAVQELNLENKVKTLRLGFSHPLPRTLLKSFVKDCEKVLVVEEGEAYMEDAVKAFAQEEGLTLQIRGKGEGLFSRLFEFDPAMVKKAIADYFGVSYQAPVKVDLSDIPEIPQRPPNLCAGCSHRATFYAVKKAAEGMDTIFPTDIGCYTLGFLPPLAMGDYLLCMGSSAGTSGGFSKTTDRKVIAFIGDSTFFHSGIAGLINGVFNNHNFTLVILDNGTTAMTGHQPHPGVDMGQLKCSGYGQISIEEIVRAVGVCEVQVIRPYRLKKSIEAVKKALEFEGVSVVISKEACTLFSRYLQKPLGKPFYISDKCKNHRSCITDLGCPAFYIQNNRVKIDPAICTGCTVCAQVCPERAILPVKER